MPEKPKTTRTRRTPEQARALILEAAQARLIKFGVRGLTIKDVAADTDINHGTLLHHFGSAEGMRHELLSKMTSELTSAMATILETTPSPESSVSELFKLMGSSGHIKLLAWRAMEDRSDSKHTIADSNIQNIQSIIEQITQGLSDHDRTTAMNMVFLAVSATVGWGICGDGFQQMLGMSPTQQENFPSWVGEQIAKLVVTD